MTAASTSATARLIQKIVRQLGEGEHDRAVDGTGDVAELLDRADHAEWEPTAARRVHVRDQGEGGRQQSAGAHALHDPPDDHAGQVVRRGGHQRAEPEDDQRAHEHGSRRVGRRCGR